MISGELVVKSNALIQGRFYLTQGEQRLVLLAITSVRRDQPLRAGAWYTVSAEALADAAGIDRSRAYHGIVEALNSLWLREVEISGGANGAPVHKNGEETIKTRWIQAQRRNSGEGSVSIIFADLLLPFLGELKSHFTQYEVRFVAPMKSRFGPRLYELLVQRRQFGVFNIDLCELQRMWGTKYARVYDFQKNAIRPAIEDVNDYSDLNVEAVLSKRGRRVVAVQFKFRSTP